MVKRQRGQFTMGDVQRFGAGLLQQQLMLCEEWRMALFDSPPRVLESWEKEVAEFTGGEPLSGGAWARLQHWYKTQHRS
jgi:hypothetical protein